MKDFSVVVPVYNSEDTLEELFESIKNVFEGMKKTFEVVFVEDCGTDKSWEVLKDLKKKFPKIIKAVKLNKNFGQHNTTMCGFGFTEGKNIITIDDDLQNPPKEIKKLIDTFMKKESDITYGIYTKKQHSRARNFMSKSVKKSSKIFLNRTGEGSSFRIISRKIIEKIIIHNQNFIFIDEVIQWYTDNISFVNVEHRKRRNNKSGYSPRALFRLASNLTYYYTNIPLKIMVYSGLIISFLSFILAIKFIIQKIFFNVPLGYTSLIVVVLFSTSIIVFSLGVIGGYLSRISSVQNKKPNYSIDKVLD